MTEQLREIVCVGASHHTASLASRERFALGSPLGRELVDALAARGCVLELVAVATCNRSELYLATTDPDAAIDAAVAAYADLAGVPAAELDTQLFVHRGRDAADHLFRVAGGIESVVTGEAQIQGQLRSAHEQAHEHGTCGPVLDRLLRRAVEVGKRARTETLIGAGHASVGSVAAELAAGVRGGSLHDAQVVVVGAGKMGGLAARSLAQRGARRIDVANRSVERACQVVQRSGADGAGVPFAELDAELERCDVVVSCTNAPHLLIGPERIERAMAARDGRALVIVDLAVPRDVDPAVGSIPGVHAFDLDDLERVVAQTLDVRDDEVAAVEQLAGEAADEFAAWLRAERATPQIREMRERAERSRREELERFLQRMPHLSDDDRARIDRLTRSVVNRVLHERTVELRRAAEQRR